MSKRIYLGIDVSKGYGDFLLLDSEKGKIMDSYQLDDTFEGHAKLYKLLSMEFKDNPKLEIFAGVESTGGYENNWYHSLRNFQADFNLKVARVNPNKVKHTREAELPKNVTDTISAKAIAYYLINRGDKINYETDDKYAPIRSIWTHLNMQIKQNTEMLNHFESLLYSAHPELIQYCKSGVKEWLLKLVSKYPSALELSRARVETISKIPYVSKERAIELKKLAKQSISSANDDFYALLLSDLAKQILNKKEIIKRWKKELETKCQFPEIKLLQTIPGIGIHGAIGLMLNLGSIEKFRNHKALSSYWGVHPEMKESGDIQRVPRMSKKGRRVPRSLLFMAVLTSLRGDNHIRQLYDYYVEERGKSKMSAIGILMHKFTRIIYGMLKSKTEYDENIDKTNQDMGRILKEKPMMKDKTRRFQKYDSAAPISGRQSKKREEQIKSHDAFASISGSNICSNENLIL